MFEKCPPYVCGPHREMVPQILDSLSLLVVCLTVIGLSVFLARCLYRRRHSHGDQAKSGLVMAPARKGMTHEVVLPRDQGGNAEKPPCC